MLSTLDGAYYIERVALNTPANVIKAKKAIKKAFTYQIEKKFPWGKTELNLSIVKGIIEKAVIYTDALETGFPDMIASALTGKSFQPDEINKALSALVETESCGTIIRDILDWIEESM